MLQHQISDESQVPVTNDLAENVSNDMKKRGMKFVGPTIIYAYLQAIGVINDHAEYCFRNKELL